MEEKIELITFPDRQIGMSQDFDSCKVALSENVGSSPTREATRWYCDHCSSYFKSRSKLFEHRRTLPNFSTKCGVKIKHLVECEFCGKEWITTNVGFILHKKYCKANPNKVEKEDKLTVDGRRRISENAKKNSFRRFWEYRSKNPIIYKTKQDKEVKLDSKWELIVVKRLDELNIEWYRPKYVFTWKDYEGKEHNYFPDFYIPHYKCFIEVKSPYVSKIQNVDGKIDFIKNNYKSIKWIETEEECNTFILENLNFDFTPLQDEENENIISLIKNNNFNKKKKRSSHRNTQRERKETLKAKRLEILEKSNIDFSKFGWATKLSKIFGISSTKAGKYIRENFPEFYYSNCFIRK